MKRFILVMLRFFAAVIYGMFDAINFGRGRQLLFHYVVSGQGDTFSLPNYAGELFTADVTKTPITTMIGGINGGKVTDNDEFPCSSEYDFPAAAQPAVTEAGSATAPAASEAARSQTTNVVQIHQETIDVTYKKMANSGKMASLVGKNNNIVNELDFQTAWKLQKIARDFEYSIINGVYNKAASNAQANKTRGLLALCSGGNQVDAQAADLSKDLIKALLKDMYDGGAVFQNAVIFVNSFQKMALSELYAVAPADRTIGGVAIEQLETDFGKLGVMLHPFMPTTGMLIAELSVLDVVFQTVPGKGNLFREPLGVAGAAERHQIFGLLGLDHGPAFMHGALINLADS